MPRCKQWKSCKGVNFVGLKDAGDPVEIAKDTTMKVQMS